MPWAGMSLTKVNLDLRRLWSTFASAVAHLPAAFAIAKSFPSPALSLHGSRDPSHCYCSSWRLTALPPRCGNEARVYPFASHPVPGPPQSIAKDFLSPPGLALWF